MTKYTILEMLFSNHWQWVRRRSRKLWMRSIDPSMPTVWVRYDAWEIERYGSIGIDLAKKEDWQEVEDWRVSEKNKT